MLRPQVRTWQISYSELTSAGNIRRWTSRSQTLLYINAPLVRNSSYYNCRLKTVEILQDNIDNTVSINHFTVVKTHQKSGSVNNDKRQPNSKEPLTTKTSTRNIVIAQAGVPDVYSGANAVPHQNREQQIWFYPLVWIWLKWKHGQAPSLHTTSVQWDMLSVQQPAWAIKTRPYQTTHKNKTKSDRMKPDYQLQKSPPLAKIPTNRE